MNLLGASYHSTHSSVLRTNSASQQKISEKLEKYKSLTVSSHSKAAHQFPHFGSTKFLPRTANWFSSPPFDNVMKGRFLLKVHFNIVLDICFFSLDTPQSVQRPQKAHCESWQLTCFCSKHVGDQFCAGYGEGVKSLLKLSVMRPWPGILNTK